MKFQEGGIFKMRGRQLLFIIIITFITVVIWVVVDLTREQSKTTTSPEIQQLLTPISPEFDQEILRSL